MINLKVMYKSIVEDAKREYLRNKETKNKQNRKARKSKPALWPSDLLSCKRKAAYHLINEEQSLKFSDKSLAYMDGGNVAEDATARAIVDVLNGRQNISLKWGCWSGKADFIIGYKTNKPIIIEHKATGEKNFKRSSIPKREHVAQLALYGYLYNKLYGIKPKLILYYVGWGHFADFTLDVQATKISVVGLIDDTFITKNLRINIEKEIEDLEAVFEKTIKENQLPKRLERKSAGCTFMGKPSCQYYYSCWDR